MLFFAATLFVAHLISLLQAVETKNISLVLAQVVRYPIFIGTVLLSISKL